MNVSQISASEKSLFILLHLYNFLVEVATVGVFHYDAKSRRLFFEEALLVRNNIWVLDRCQNSNFVQSVFLLFI